MELNKKNWKRLLLLIVSGLLIAFGLQHLDEILSGISAVFSVLSPIFLGICIAFIVNVPMRPLERLWNKLFRRNPCAGKRKGMPFKEQLSTALQRPICMILSYLLIAGLLFAIVFMLIPQLKDAVEDFAAMLPGYLADLEKLWVQAQTLFADFGFVLPDFAIDISKFQIDSIINTVKNVFAQWGTHILDTTVSITTSVFSGIFNVVLALVFSIYMLAQKETLCRQIRRCLQAIFPDTCVHALTSLADLVNKSFTNFITGQLTEAVIIGVLCGIGMTIFRMPYAFVVSVIVGFTALIPVFGAYVGTAIGAFLILLAEPFKVLWFVVFIIVLQQLEGNLIYPRVVGKSVGLPGLLVLAAVTVGSSVGGILGMLLAVPICSVLFTLCTQAIDARLAKKEAAAAAVSAVREPADTVPVSPTEQTPAAYAGKTASKTKKKKK